MRGIGSVEDTSATGGEVGASSTPPWLADGEPLDLDDEFRSHALSSRAAPKPGLTLESFVEADPHLAFPSELGLTANYDESSPSLHDLLRVTMQLSSFDEMTADQALGMLVAASMTVTWQRFSAQGIKDPFGLLEPSMWKLEQRNAVQKIVGRFGAVEALKILVRSLDISVTGSGEWIEHDGSHIKSHMAFVVDSTSAQSDDSDPLAGGAGYLREFLAVVDAAEYDAALAVARDLWPQLEPRGKATIALIFPDAHDLADELIEHYGREQVPFIDYLQGVASTDELAMIASRCKTVEDYARFGNTPKYVGALVVERGIAAATRLSWHLDNDVAADALGRIGTPDAMRALLEIAHTGKGALQRVHDLRTKWPIAMAAALAEAAAGTTRAAKLAEPLLAEMLTEQPELVSTLAGWVSPAATGKLNALHDRMLGTVDEATPDQLPTVLTSPPWRDKKVKEATFDLSPLDQEPELGATSNVDWAQRLRPYQRRVTSIQDLANSICPASLYGQQNNLDATEELHNCFVAALGAGDAPGAAEAHRAWAAVAEVSYDRTPYWQVDGVTFAVVLRDELDAIRPNLGLDVWNLVAGTTAAFDPNVQAMVDVYGKAALPGATRVVKRFPTDHMELAATIGDVDFAPLMARAFHKLKSVRHHGLAWLTAFPEHAAAGLIAPALGKAGEARESARVSLQRIAGDDPAASERILAVAARYERDDVIEATRHMLQQDPLERFPARIPKLPAWWNSRAWNRPKLRTGESFPIDAIDRFGTMLAFTVAEGDPPYPGIEQVVEVSDPQSLADFGSDVYHAWLAGGGTPKEAWAMTMLGYLGNDQTARDLTADIRMWPGESQHKRAVTGLGVLRNIGTDVAIMLLNGVATKVKFKALQERAREQIAAIAEERGLSADELGDRLAPDLGLGENGTMTLDFGPRSFTVGFDEALKPFVRDEAGKRLKGLPKPRQSDDAAIAAESVKSWRALKKDARTVASQQLVRLEVAMCTQREWTLEVFEQFFVQHPLVRHLVQRLVWATYVADAPHTFFRVAEDGEYTDADDEPIELPADAIVRIPHALEIPDAVGAAFGQLLADYELLQPFDQLSRDSSTLTDSERADTDIKRWSGRVVNTGSVLGLTSRGWRRGDAADGGVVTYMEKPLQDGRSIVAHLDPGLFTGYLSESPEQTITGVQVGKASWGDVRNPEPFSTLSPIAASELIRDLDALSA